MINNREIALDILMEINEKEQYLHILLNDALRKYQYLEKNERAFISRLVRGTLERRITLDYIINQFSKVPVNKMKPLIRNLMRMSVYQMMYMEQIPISAICNEAVKLAEKRKFAGLKGFVNGVLRNIGRQLAIMELPDNASIQYSMPEYLIDIWKNAYGENAVNRMLPAFLEDKKITIITNTGAISANELKNKLEAEGVSAEKSEYVKNAFTLSNINYLEDLEAFRAGLFNIQDISSMLSGVIAAPQKGNKIIDVCAAPGGKSIFAALALEGTGMVEARDITFGKVEQINENIERLNINNINADIMDATVLDEASIESADIVIADVPCSGLGIIGRKPDIKYNISMEKLEQIKHLQRNILDVVTRYVKKDGYIIFSTCTLNPSENEENVEYICSKGYERVDISELIPEKIYADSKMAGEDAYNRLISDAKNGYITLIPGINECDGFFVAKLRKC